MSTHSQYTPQITIAFFLLESFKLISKWKQNISCRKQLPAVVAVLYNLISQFIIKHVRRAEKNSHLLQYHHKKTIGFLKWLLLRCAVVQFQF